MDLFGFTEFSTVFTLGNRATLFLDFEERTVCMSAGRRPMTLDAGLAEWE
jgi:hypothetical protein